jgi:hypothetical protein
MTNEEAIRGLQHIRSAIRNGIPPTKPGKAIEAIDHSVAALERDRWIPCEERLPEQDGKYLTVRTLKVIPLQPWIEVCWFAKDLHRVDRYEFQKKKPGFYQSDSEYGYYEVSEITHWMPLPEPPKEET